MKNVVNNKIKELGNLKDNKETLLEIYSIYLGFLSSMFDLAQNFYFCPKLDLSQVRR